LDGIDIHLIELVAMIGHRLAVDDLKPIDKRFRFLSPMRLDNANHHINAVRFARTSRHQHFIGLANAGCCSQKYLETAARFALCLFKQRIGGRPHIAKAKIVRYQASFLKMRRQRASPPVERFHF
jgi:hypothetical protein